MRPIQMVDLFNQYNKIKGEIDSAINNVLTSSKFIKGAEVELFEKELADYLKVKHVISCANGTDALMIALLALDLKENDEIIVPSFSFVATAEVVPLLKLKPVFADIDPYSYNIDTYQLKDLINTRAKAIIPVHLFGQSAYMEVILKIANDHNLFVIEDAAQSLGCDYIFDNKKIKKTGTLGNIGCTSFFPSKNLGCFGDGGALFTDDDYLAEKIRMIANHGSTKKYYHEMIGINSRLDTIQAAILRVKLRYLDQYNKKRQEVANYYYENLKNIDEIILPKKEEYSTHIFNQFTIRVKEGKRDKLKDFLSKNDIPTMIYYPLPLHLQPAFRLYAKTKEIMESEKASSEVLSLPMHTELDDEQLLYITQKIKEFYYQ